jgi:hypothetical protein
MWRISRQVRAKPEELDLDSCTWRSVGFAAHDLPITKECNQGKLQRSILSEVGSGVAATFPAAAE